MPKLFFLSTIPPSSVSPQSLLSLSSVSPIAGDDGLLASPALIRTAGTDLNLLSTARDFGGGGSQVVVQVIDLPFDAVRIPDPELVLIGVAAVDSHLLVDRNSSCLHAGEMRHHRLGRVHLDAQVMHHALTGASGQALGQRQVDRRKRGKKFDVASPLFDRGDTEELSVELATLCQIRHVDVYVHLGAHGILL